MLFDGGVSMKNNYYKLSTYNSIDLNGLNFVDVPPSVAAPCKPEKPRSGAPYAVLHSILPARQPEIGGGQGLTGTPRLRRARASIEPMGAIGAVATAEPIILERRAADEEIVNNQPDSANEPVDIDQPDPAGEQGDKGPTGPAGEQGDKGPTGPMGERGDKGATGPIGEQGDKGQTGPAGEQGDKGPTGIQGVQGLQGEQGPVGIEGPIGIQGPQGAQGEQGPVGLRGSIGDKGPTGAIGPAGSAGAAYGVFAFASAGGFYIPGISNYIQFASLTEAGGFKLEGAGGDSLGAEPGISSTDGFTGALVVPPRAGGAYYVMFDIVINDNKSNAYINISVNGNPITFDGPLLSGYRYNNWTVLELHEGDHITLTFTDNENPVDIMGGNVKLYLAKIASLPSETPAEEIAEESCQDDYIPEEDYPQEYIAEEGGSQEDMLQEDILEDDIPEEAIPEELIPEEAISEEAIPEEFAPEEYIEEEEIFEE
jgi:hypothetical protein